MAIVFNIWCHQMRNSSFCVIFCLKMQSLKNLVQLYTEIQSPIRGEDHYPRGVGDWHYPRGVGDCHYPTVEVWVIVIIIEVWVIVIILEVWVIVIIRDGQSAVVFFLLFLFFLTAGIVLFSYSILPVTFPFKCHNFKKQ